MLGNIGFAAVGTLLSCLVAGLRQRAGVLALLLLPLVAPVILGSAEATTMLLAGQMDALWWRWIQFLSIFAALFTVVGALAFELVVEE
jgi:heme exporter protein B